MKLARKENIVLEKSIQLSLKAIEFCELLESNRKYIIANQLLRSCTGIGANIHEAQMAESKKDFVHKMKIAAKELEEAKYWMVLCKEAENYPFDENLNSLLEEVGLILYKILHTSKNH